MKIIAWNVNGLRAIVKKENVNLFLEENNPDVFCMGETKLSCPDDKFQNDFLSIINGFKFRYYNTCSKRKGYSGSAIYCKKAPLSVFYGIPDFVEEEGRVITIEYKKLYIVHVYTPNSGQALQRLKYRVEVWDCVFWNYIKNLKKKKSIILCGDLNCALNEIELYSPKTNLKSAGYTIEERTSLKQYLNDLELIDTFRYLYPTLKHKYTYWSNMRKSREQNKGWRIDYFIIDNKLKKNIKESNILENQMGSDHAPIMLELKLSL